VEWIADLETGRRAYQTGHPADGIEPLRRLLARNPDNVPALLALGVCLLGTDQPERAVAMNRRALKLRPDDDLVRFNLANSLSVLGRSVPAAAAEAAEHYERAVNINPRFADAYLNYASHLERNGAETEAVAVLERAVASGIGDPDLENRIALTRLKRGDVEGAKEAFSRSLDLAPNAPEPLEAMAVIASRQGRWTDAVVYYEQLLAVALPSRREELRRVIDELKRRGSADGQGDS